MDQAMVVLKSLIFLTVTAHPASAVTHSLQYFYTGVTGLNFPEFTAVGQVDGEPFVYYDSNIRKMIPKTEWIQKAVGDDPDYWDRNTQKMQGTQESFKVNADTVKQRFNQTKGLHTVQILYGCELEDDQSKRGYRQDGYDGEDFISLDLNTGSWIASILQAVPTKHKWEKNGETGLRKNYLESECIEWLQKYVNYSRSTLERKDPPEVSLFQKDSSSPVVCHATGFFPKAVMISWQKNGEDLNEDVDLRETLPNQDGTFQKRSILTLSPEELKNNQYSCVVQHSSLENGLVLPVSDCRILQGVQDGKLSRVSVGKGVAVLLIVLIICVVGVLSWRKKSGFVPLSRSSSSASEPSKRKK